MKFILFFTFILSALNIQASSIAYSDVKEFNLDQKIQMIEAYRAFFREYKTTLSASHQSDFFKKFSVISEAYAADYNCFYAGWPSLTVRGKCTNPSRTNASYISSASSARCSSSQLMCNPILFGLPGICVNTSNQALRNTAYSQCETNYASQRRTTAQVAASLNSGNLPTQADEMFQLANTICSSGFQAGSRMCQNLKDKLTAIKNVAPTPATAATVQAPQTPLRPVAAPQRPTVRPPQPQASIPLRPQTQVSGERSYEEVLRSESPEAYARYLVTQVQLAPAQIAAATNATLDCPPEENAPATIPTPAPVDPRNALNEDGSAVYFYQNRFQCPNAPASSENLSQEELSRLVERYNLSFYPNSEITQTQDFRSFLFEMNKFPRSLLNEMADSGGRINLIVGTGVTDDPTFTILRGSNGLTPDGRNLANIQGTGGTAARGIVNTPTRIVINNLYNRTFDSNQSHGSSNLFLHEHAHSLDSLYGQFAISRSKTFRDLLALPSVVRYMNRILGSYERLQPKEAFGELFAYYHSCAGASADVQSQAPEIADFFNNLTNVRAYLDSERANGRTPADAEPTR